MQGPLDGYRVVLEKPSAAGLYAGWLLAGLGARVVPVNIDQTIGAGILEWLTEGMAVGGEGGVPRPDVVIKELTGDLERGIEPELPEFPGVPVVVFISPLGLEGPLAGRRAGVNEACAFSGLTSQTGFDGEIPHAVDGLVVEFSTGANAAAAALIGLYHRNRTSAPESFRADVSMLETAIGLQGPRALIYAQTGLVYRRQGFRSPGLRGLLPTEDGYIATLIRGDWNEFFALLGIEDRDLPPAWRTWPDYRRLVDPDILSAVEKAMHRGSRRHWTETGQLWRMPILPVLTPSELLDDPHLSARQFWLREPGQPPRPVHPLSGIRWRNSPSQHSVPRFPPPPPPASTRGQEPLSGMKVTEFAMAWTTPMAAQYLAMFGADVIKVESPQKADMARGLPLLDLELRLPWYEFSCNYQPQNAGKLNIAIDFTTKDGLGVRDRLFKWSDVVLTNFSVRALDNLGLDGPTVTGINSACTVVNSTGFGRTGPYKQYTSFGITLEGMTGLSILNASPGDGDVRPFQSSFYHPDVFASLHQVIAAISGALQAQRHGNGAAIDLCQLEVGILPIFPSTAAGMHKQTMPESFTLQADGEAQWVTCTIHGPGDLHRLREELRKAHFPLDVQDAQQSAWVETLRTWAIGQTRSEVESVLSAAGIACAPVLNPDEVLRLDHLSGRRYFNWWHRDMFGRRPAIGRWFRIMGRETTPIGPIHLFGEDNERVAKDYLGVSDEEYQSWVANGTVSSVPIGVAEIKAPVAAPLEWMLDRKEIWRRDSDYMSVVPQ